MNRSRIKTIVSLAIVGSLISCGKEEKKTEKKPQPYQVMQLLEKQAYLSEQYPATIQGKQNIDIRPKVDGYVHAIHVDEGQQVQKGQLLFTIFNPQFEQDLRTAEAALQSALAQVTVAKLQVTKTKPLVEKDIISKYELDAAQLQLKAQEANVAQARARVENAKVNAGYTKIYSPVSGVVGTLPLRNGSYVSSSSSMPLTTVSEIGNVYVYFSINEKEILSLLKQENAENIQSLVKKLPPVTLLLSDGTPYPVKGKLESASGLINQQTGSFNLRAIFNNDMGILRSGASGSIIIPRYKNDAILIPQKSTYEIQGQKFAYKLINDSLVKSTAIKVQDVPGGDLFIVLEGLNKQDKIVIEGIATLKDSLKIIPKFVSADSLLRQESIAH